MSIVHCSKFPTPSLQPISQQPGARSASFCQTDAHRRYIPHVAGSTKTDLIEIFTPQKTLYMQVRLNRHHQASKCAVAHEQTMGTVNWMEWLVKIDSTLRTSQFDFRDDAEKNRDVRNIAKLPYLRLSLIQHIVKFHEYCLMNQYHPHN